MWETATGNKKKWIQNSLILGTVLLLIILISAVTGAAPNDPAPPAPAGLSSTDGNGAYKTGDYRNLFVESGSYTDAQVDARLQEIWDQLFYGTDNERVYFPTGTDEAFILDIGSNDIRSEGMSYGMMIAVQMDKQEEFDRLWRWAYNHMYHKDPSHPNYGYFSWEIKPTAPFDPCDENPAPDGEEYFAMALYFADGRWGSETGADNPINYKQWADKIVTDMVTRETKSGTIVQIGSPGQNCATSTANSRTVTTLGMMHPTEKKIRFSTDSSSADWSDPSYHLPAFYELFSRWAPSAEVRQFWADATQESRDYFLEATNTNTCLNPDYANWDGSPKSASWNSDTVHFQYDAWRTAMNWGLDYSWWAKDGRQQDLSNCIQSFFESEGMTAYGNRYTLDGSQLSQDRSPGLIATNAATGLAATDSRAWAFVDSFWNTAIPTGQWRYYDGMLYMLSYLETSGNYRIYTPGTPPEPTPTPDPNVTETAVPPTNTPIPPHSHQYSCSGWFLCGRVSGCESMEYRFPGQR